MTKKPMRMARVVIVGGGAAGLALALFAARRGHQMVLVERDAAAPEGSPDEIFDSWHRPGLPQARHSHKFLGLSCQVLTREAPDVLDDLRAGGAMQVPISRFGMSPAHPDEFALAARRVVYEAIVRRAVEREPGVELLLGRRVRGLITEERSGVPVVRGVHLNDGRTLAADLVVDAAGRNGRLLHTMPQVRLPAAQTQRCGFVYMTRHYRLRPGRELPALDRPLAQSLGYGATLAFPADNGTFSLSLTLSTQDPFRHALRRLDIWDRFIASVPHTARWSCTGQTWGGIQVMSGIEDRWQRLVDADGPVVGGLVLLGDAALQNNPTYGRGVSLAFAQAKQVAETVGAAADDALSYVDSFERWTAKHLGIWHRAQTTADAAALAIMEAGLRGEAPPVPTDPFSRLMMGIEALSVHDEVVARALARMAHLLITPSQLIGDRDVVRRVTTYLNSHEIAQTPSEGPTRSQFEAIACQA